MYINLTGTGDFRLSGQSKCYWLPDDASVAYNCVFIGDKVVLTGSWDGAEKDDGLIRVTLDGTTIGAYYASHDLVNDVWSLEVDITYLLKDLTEPYTGWGGLINQSKPTKSYTERTLLVMTENTQSVNCEADIVILGGHRLAAMPHPLYEEMLSTVPEDVHSNSAICRVQPPNIMLQLDIPNYSDFRRSYPVWFECGNDWKHNTTGTASILRSQNPNLSNGNGGSVGIATKSPIYWIGKDGTYKIQFQAIDMNECQNYAVVRWKSKTGNWRQHIFEVRNITDNLDGSTVIDNIGTSYRSLVENSYQFDIHLSGLTRYSLWYYQDILSSEEIYCCVGNTQAYDFTLLTQWVDPAGAVPETLPTTGPSELLCSVVSPKKYTVPNGNGQLYDFDCTLKYKKTSY